jgi:hypothetical protein
MLLFFSLACNPGGIPAESAKSFVQEQALAVNPGGRVGLEFIGKAQWVKGPQFDRECLMSKDIAFTDSGNTVSPTYKQQQFLTTATDRGWCVYLGDNIQVDVGAPAVNGGGWVVPVVYSVSNPTPWAECLRTEFRNRTVSVYADENGEPKLKGDLAFLAGDCPTPMPGGETRKSGQRPNAKAPKTPSKAQALEVLQAFDQALFERDWLGALDQISCYNLLEEGFYASCAPSDLLQVGPHPRGQERTGDGPPWTEYSLKALSDVQTVRSGKEGMVHVVLEHKRTKKLRSVSLEWTGQEWKVVGIIHKKGHDLSTVRFLNDLHDPAKATILERRIAGEKIDEKGEWLPGFDPADQLPE